MRQLRYHEQKLLKKVNFLEWKNTNTTREHFVIGKYNLKDREEYTRYNQIVGKIRKITEMLSRLKDNDYTKKTISTKLVRSEERRVGKECRSGGGPGGEEKKRK